MSDEPDRTMIESSALRADADGDGDGDTGWLDSRAAAKQLGVSRDTLYAYVSRGLLQAHRSTGQRASRYRRADVARLAHEHQHARRPAQTARGTLDWGRPVLSSSLCLIEQGRLYYRGQDALALARSSTLESLAALLWQAPDNRVFAQSDLPASARPASACLRRMPELNGLPIAQRILLAFGWLAAPWHLSDQNEFCQADCLVARMVQAACPDIADNETNPAQPRPVHKRLQAVWRTHDEAGERIRSALILCADHELNVSSFTARCVASTGAGLDACVSAALAALTGIRHAGVTKAIEDLWDRCLVEPSQCWTGATLAYMASNGLAASTRAAEPSYVGLPGFGHPLYPDGDPRAEAILEGIRLPTSIATQVDNIYQRSGYRPSLDFALVAMRRAAGLPPGSAFALFAIARTVGWIAHVLEQVERGSLIRPRATYDGIRPVQQQASPSPLPGRIIRQR